MTKNPSHTEYLVKWIPEIAKIPRTDLLIIAACVHNKVLHWAWPYAAYPSLVASAAARSRSLTMAHFFIHKQQKISFDAHRKHEEVSQDVAFTRTSQLSKHMADRPIQ